MFDDIIGKPPLQEKFIDELWQRLKEPIDNKILEWVTDKCMEKEEEQNKK